MPMMNMLEALKAIKPGQMFIIPFAGDKDDDIVVRWEKDYDLPEVLNMDKHRFTLHYRTKGIFDIKPTEMK